MASFVGTVASGASVDLTMPKPGLTRHIQVDATNTGTLEILTKVHGKTGFTSKTSIAQKAIIIDMIDVKELQLSATGGTVDYTVSVYRDS